MWIIDKVPSASRTVNAAVVFVVVVAAVALAMICVQSVSGLRTTEVVTGSAIANAKEVGEYKTMQANFDAAMDFFDLIEVTPPLYEQVVEPTNTPQQNLDNFRRAYCAENVRSPLGAAEDMIDAAAVFDRFKDAGLLPGTTGDFWTEVPAYCH